MKIQSMFQKDINRSIKGVIQVGQDDNEILRQELEEYIITKELHRHFDTFFENYSKAIDQPTDKVGVWISGFFGSGKSHFLKILSYLLSNSTVDGKKAVEFFKDKFNNPMMYANVVRCANIPTESILFNIDNEGPIQKNKTAVLRVFAKVFYNHLGFYGEDLKTAKLERFIEQNGKTDEFRKAFEEINGLSWVESRASCAFFEDHIVSVLQSVLGMSENAARNWFNGEENVDMSIKTLVEEIKSYVDGKSQDFRLLFCVDEVGQYIGDDSNLMLNLQTIVEEIGSQCQGKVWVMVTSQEAIDSVVKISGNDFSKIQGRFNTRLSLTSNSVDEVIKKRILEKTADAKRLLELVYDKEHAVLKNLFTFNNAVLDIKGYMNSREFSATYPFVPYQFTIIQKVLAEIRKHGNSGKHISGGERSMLSGFQEAAQKIQDQNENTLIPFHQFYDTIHTFLDSPIRRVIDRCQNAADNNDGLDQRDVSVLKLLYLVRYIDDIKTNIDNIAILMVDNIHTDKINLRKEIAESLERLERQNYVARNGDNYSFLTDEEQEIATDIRNTTVDSATIVKSIGDTIFNDIYNSKKFKLREYDFTYDRYIDETCVGSANGRMHLRFVTGASDYNTTDEQLILNSRINNEAIIILSTKVEYFEKLETAAKIRKYIKQKNVSQLPESIQSIIRGRQDQAQRLEESAKIQITKAITDGEFFIYGEKVEIKYGDAKSKIDEALKQLTENVYYNLDLVKKFSTIDKDIYDILNSEPEQVGFAESGSNNEFAVNEISLWLEDRQNSYASISMDDVQQRYQDIPYGWREIDIAALMARLIVAQKIEIRYGGAVIGKDNKNLVDYLRKKNETDKVSVSRRIVPSEELIKKSMAFLREWLGKTDIPTDENGLITFVVKHTLEPKLGQYKHLIEEYKRDSYPQKEVVTTACNLINDILSQERDNVALLTRLIDRQDDLLDSAEDMEAVETFFKSQRPVFDAALKLQKDLQDERNYFDADLDTAKKINEISSVLAMPKPYGRIKDLPEMIQSVKKAYSTLLDQKKEEVLGIIEQYTDDIHTLASGKSQTNNEVEKSDNHFNQYKQKAAAAQNLTTLDAMITQLKKYKDQVYNQIEIILQEQTTKPGEQPIKQQKIERIRRENVFPAKHLTSREDVDDYLNSIRQKLYDMIESNDGIQIN